MPANRRIFSAQYATCVESLPTPYRPLVNPREHVAGVLRAERRRLRKLDEAVGRVLSGTFAIQVCLADERETTRVAEVRRSLGPLKMGHGVLIHTLPAVVPLRQNRHGARVLDGHWEQRVSLTELTEVRGVGSGVLAVSIVSLDKKKFKLVEVAAC